MFACLFHIYYRVIQYQLKPEVIKTLEVQYIIVCVQEFHMELNPYVQLLNLLFLWSAMF